MNKTFIISLGTASIAGLAGIITGDSGEATLSTISYTIMGIATIITILITVNPDFLKNLNKLAVISLASGISFSILAFYLNRLGSQEEENIGKYATMTLIFATIAVLSIFNAISYGAFYESTRKRSLLLIVLNLTLYIPATWIVIGGPNATLEMFTAPIADQIVNVIPQEFGVIDAFVKIVISIVKLQPIKINGVLPFPHLFLLVHLGWNLIKIMRSYGWWFIGSSLTIPFLIIIWTKHIPKELCPKVYIMMSVSLIIGLTFIISFWKHRKVEVID